MLLEAEAAISAKFYDTFKDLRLSKKWIHEAPLQPVCIPNPTPQFIILCISILELLIVLLHRLQYLILNIVRLKLIYAAKYYKKNSTRLSENRIIKFCQI